MADNNKYTLGTNNRIVITDEGSNIEISESILNFQSKPDDEHVNINHMNGRRGTLLYMTGWSGSFEMARQSPIWDKYRAAQEAKYHNGDFSSKVTIMQNIKEPDGSITQWQFVNVTLIYDDAGTFQHGSEVRQRVSFMAERRIPR